MVRFMVCSIILFLTSITGAGAGTPVSQVNTIQLKTPGPTLPQATTMVVLIRSVLIALNNANQTDNYTVMRALGSSGFQSANTPAKLALHFTKLRNRNLDLAPALLFQPKLIRRPAITNKGLLRLTGYFETRPEQVNFDFGFQLEEGRWRLFAILINVAKVKVISQTSDKMKKTSVKRKKRVALIKTTVKTFKKKTSAAKPKQNATEISMNNWSVSVSKR